MGLVNPNIVLKYLFNGIENDDRKSFIQKTVQYLSENLRGEVMTLAEMLRREGFEDGVEKGIERGVEEERRDIALRLLRENVNLDFICKITELSLQQIQNLKHVH